MEDIHTQGIWIAERLQQRTLNHEAMWLVITHIGDPKAAFLLVFPFTYFFSKRIGVAVLWIAAVSEWLNLVFKWMLFGERPYWWIGESRLFVNKEPDVHQFSATCETGPGSPSGHAMVTAAVWWIVVSSLGSFLYSRTRSVTLSAAPYLFYLVMLLTVGLSRIFILAHFPHQVVTGSITGFFLGVFLSRRVPDHRSLLFFFSLSTGLLLGTVLLHAGLQWLGIDLSWSIALSKKWCSREEWVRLDSTPFSSLTRDCGALLGLGMAQYWKPGGWSLPWAPRALSLAISSMGLYHINRLPLPIRPVGLFYGLFFVKFVMVPQIVMLLVPGLVHLFTHKRKSD
ncbi:glucose-6-phosphatase 3 [Clinocottus analis]|uniref:glucose-6-phosphatase 3 n=1 Tax=Clinocottus analis TaxID=304258 RepID=UPI0035C26123